MATKKKGLFINHADDRAGDLGREFVADPKAFALRHGLDPNSLACPDVAHAAFARGTAFKEAAEASGIVADVKSMTKLRKLATKHFGADPEVTLIPFGLKFRERTNASSQEITATGSGTVTFLDGDADVDG